MHLRRLRALGLAGALLAPLTAASARPRAQSDLLDRAVAAWAKVKTARATFEQTITNSLTGRTLKATGEYPAAASRQALRPLRGSRERSHRRRRQAALALPAEQRARPGHPHRPEGRRQRHRRSERAVPHRATLSLHHHAGRGGRPRRPRDAHLHTRAEGARAMRPSSRRRSGSTTPTPRSGSSR